MENIGKQWLFVSVVVPLYNPAESIEASFAADASMRIRGPTERIVQLAVAQFEITAKPNCLSRPSTSGQ